MYIENDMNYNNINVEDFQISNQLLLRPVLAGKSVIYMCHMTVLVGKSACGSHMTFLAEKHYYYTNIFKFKYSYYHSLTVFTKQQINNVVLNLVKSHQIKSSFAIDMCT